ncbi:chemotaxis protein CheB [Mycolicibacterium sp. F2034L]|uniref:chemotaxis protein CheB n=1 Tax=Mycolicibacterium sp. F2034L TaxID=2926422 RepID=UPI001FF1D7F7|nr:chemotaxis protein CheB [Mycolicibacterium sp. F2034L]MCK0176937.1 chemotaxis protein CheB [Mycolicibacterium sp. F2034L]
MHGSEVIVIGGSAGGLKAVQGILRGLTDLRGSVVVAVLHRPPAYSPLANVLQTYTRLPVREPDNSPWECPANTVVVAPAGYQMLLGRRRRLSENPPSPVTPYESQPGVRAHLTLDAPVAYSRPSIDVTFTSAAGLPGPVTAVLLSCANDDGAAGCAAVRAAGGRVVLQDPATCEAPIAVIAALRRVEPDHIADPEGIGAWLAESVGTQLP